MRRAGRRAVPGRHGTCACLLSIGRATPTLVKSVYDVQTGQACSKMRLGFVCVFFSGLPPGCPCAPAIQSWIRANKLPLLGRTRTRTAEQSTHGARADWLTLLRPVLSPESPRQTIPRQTISQHSTEIRLPWAGNSLDPRQIRVNLPWVSAVDRPRQTRFLNL